MLILLLLVAVSCSGRKSKAEHRGIIPEDDLVSILSDVYIADGILTIPKIRLYYMQSDSLSPYKDIIENYGYTKDLMDKTLRFYFVKRPGKLIGIYDKVLSHLSELESRYQNEMPVAEQKRGSLWAGRSFYIIPGRISEDTVSYSVVIRRPGNYTLQYTLALFHDDQTPDPRQGFYFVHPDSLYTGKRHYFTSLPYIKDGRPHRYSVRQAINTSQPVILRGWFVNHADLSPEISRHQIIEDITLTHSILRK